MDSAQISDRELLELAAKAAGLLPLPEGKELDYSADGGLTFSGGGEYTKWNPLTDDGDALRLAVKLKLWIAPCDDGALIEVSNRDDSAFICQAAADQPEAAMRRAIVRCAALIGAKP